MTGQPSDPRQRHAPAWMTVLIIVCMLPVLAFPSLLAMSPADPGAGALIWLYPFYVIASGVCAWICYPARKEICWILLILMLLSHAAMWALVTGNN